MSASNSDCATTFGDGASVLERVLLAIINTHTPDITDGRQAERLQTAMSALMGPIVPDERDMEQALLFMSRQRQTYVCNFEMQALRSCTGVATGMVPTVRELAALAAREVMGCSSTDDMQAVAGVLCQMFRERGNAERDYVGEALETEAVERIVNELAEWGFLGADAR